MCFFLRSVHVCIFACICCTNTWCLCVHMQFSVCLNMSVCQGVEESDTHVLARTHCVGWGCVQSRILPMSPSLSVSRSCYCLLVRLLPLTLLPIVTCFIYRSNIDPCWRKWHSYCEVHTQGNKLEVCSSGHRSSFHVSQKYSLTIRDFSLTYRGSHTLHGSMEICCVRLISDWCFWYSKASYLFLNLCISVCLCSRTSVLIIGKHA